MHFLCSFHYYQLIICALMAPHIDHIDHQGPKPSKSPRITPFVFPNLTNILGWVGSHIWENFPKKRFFWTAPVIVYYVIFTRWGERAVQCSNGGGGRQPGQHSRRRLGQLKDPGVSGINILNNDPGIPRFSTNLVHSSPMWTLPGVLFMDHRCRHRLWTFLALDSFLTLQVTMYKKGQVQKS